MIGIYKITSPDGKVYVGQSIDIEKRFNQHKTGNSSNKKLTESIKKYGWENHIIEVILECDIEELNNKESEWIKFYKENYTVFNDTQGRPKRPNMIQITRKVHINALERVNKFIEKENQKELKKESKTKLNGKRS